jgi:hypothetical protein
MQNCTRGLAVGGYGGRFLIVDRVGSVGVVIGVRSHAGEVLSVYLMNADIEKGGGVPHVEQRLERPGLPGRG